MISVKVSKPNFCLNARIEKSGTTNINKPLLPLFSQFLHSTPPLAQSSHTPRAESPLSGSGGVWKLCLGRKRKEKSSGFSRDRGDRVAVQIPDHRRFAGIAPNNFDLGEVSALGCLRYLFHLSVGRKEEREALFHVHTLPVDQRTNRHGSL